MGKRFDCDSENEGKEKEEDVVDEKPESNKDNLLSRFMEALCDEFTTKGCGYGEKMEGLDKTSPECLVLQAKMDSYLDASFRVWELYHDVGDAREVGEYMEQVRNMLKEEGIIQ